MDNITDSFTIGTISYRTILNIPFSNEVNLTLNPLVGSGWVNVCSKFTSINFSSTPFDTIINYDTSAAYVQSHPTWLVSFRSKEHSEDPWVEWMPFGRCTCPPVRRPNGTISSMGDCGSRDFNYTVCGRGGI
ncbi:MAG: hypothetical protein H7296_13310 [Bacteroidia bacterium]|nr:hypothetical protein [Bacteroidia bacterium]